MENVVGSMIRKQGKSGRLPSLVIALLLFVSSCAAAPKKAPADQKNFLWSVRSETAIVYLHGSIHVGKPDFYPLSPAIETAFDQSDTLVVEVDPEESDAAQLQAMLLKYGVYPEGERLDRKISKETYALAEGKFKETGLPMTTLNQFKPWVLAVLLEAAELQRLGFDRRHGIDEYFLNKARGKKRITAFETADFQIGLLDRFSEPLQELFLRYTISDLNLMAHHLDAIVAGWKGGDADAVARLIFQNINEQPELAPVYDRLIHERNAQMASGIEAFLKTKSHYFVVVGSGHLVGPRGIVELLRAKGYAVEQL